MNELVLRLFGQALAHALDPNQGVLLHVDDSWFMVGHNSIKNTIEITDVPVDEPLFNSPLMDELIIERVHGLKVWIRYDTIN